MDRRKPFGVFSTSAGCLGCPAQSCADAKSVFDLLFADAETVAVSAHDVEPDGCRRVEVGCWFHCRKRFWEAAVSKQELGREGLYRISRIFELDASWKKKPPSEVKQLRLQYLWPHVNDFFEWMQEQRPLFASQRGIRPNGVGIRAQSEGRVDALLRKTVGWRSATMALNALSNQWQSGEGRGSSVAAMTTPRAPQPCFPSSAPRGCTASNPKSMRRSIPGHSERLPMPRMGYF